MGKIMVSEEEFKKLGVGTVEAEFFKEKEKNTVPSPHEMEKLIQDYHKGNIEARNEIITRNIGLVVGPAKKYLYQVKNMDFMDLIQEGIIGMMRSIKTFDPTKGSFSTYATPWIDEYIRRAVFNQDHLIKEPEYIVRNSIKYKRLIEKGLTDKEICKELKISQDILEYLKIREKRSFVSLNNPLSEEENSATLEEFIPNEIDYIENFFNDNEESILFSFLKYCLKQEDYFILYYRVLLPKPLRLEMIGKEIGVTRERIRVKERRIKEKVKIYFKDNKKVYYKELKAIDPTLLAHMRKKPLTPRDITTYLYLKDYLKDIEYKIYYYLFIGKEELSLKEISELLHISYEETQTYAKNINRVLNGIDEKEYETVHQDLITRLKFTLYKYAVLDAIPPEKDYIFYKVNQSKKNTLKNKTEKETN